MKKIFFTIALSLSFTFSYCQIKCDSIHHYLKEKVNTFPPFYKCECGRELTFNIKTFMALEQKYGENKVDSVVKEYMQSGKWEKGKEVITPQDTQRYSSTYDQIQKRMIKWAEKKYKEGNFLYY